MSKMDIAGLAVAITGIIIALAIAWQILREEMEEDSSSDEPVSFPIESDHDPDGDGRRGDDGSRRNTALDMIDGRSTRRRGEPMLACASFPRGMRVDFSHGRREISGTVTGGAGRRLNLLGELPGDRIFLTRRKVHEVH